MKNWKKTIIKIMFGQSVSLITSSIVQYAIIWYITYKTESAFWLSIATLAGFLPQGILGLFIGNYIDRNNRKKIMIYSDLFIAIISLIMVIYGTFTELPIWLILICLSLRSVGAAFHSPSLQASIPLIVPEDKMLKYSGYNQTLLSLGLIISPVIAAFLYEHISLASIILIDVLGAIVALMTLIISNIPNIKNKEAEKLSFWRETKEGIQLILKNKLVKYIFIITAIYSLLYMPINSLFPLMTISYFGKTTYHVGIIETVFSVGMLIGGLALANNKVFQNKRRNIYLSILLMGLSILASGILSNAMFLGFLVFSLIMGFTGPITQGTISTVFAEQISPNYLGRIYSNYMSLTVLIMPVGLLIAGLLVDTIKINNWFIITGLLIIFLGIYTLINKISFEKIK